MNYYSTPPTSDEIWHHGIKGMRWGVRRYQNEDGSLTPAGEKRYVRESISGIGLTKKGLTRKKRLANKVDRYSKKLRNYSSKQAEYQALSKSSKEYVKDDINRMIANDPKWKKLNDAYRRASDEQRNFNNSTWKSIDRLSKERTQRLSNINRSTIGGVKTQSASPKRKRKNR